MRRAFIPTISELQAFRACVRFGTTMRAADHLGLTQSSVSRSVGQLEDRLGVHLFHRVRQRLVLSDAGRRFLRDADAILDDLHEAAVRVMAFGGQADVLSLAVLPTFADRWLIPRLGRFHKLAPHVTVDIAVRLVPVDLEAEPFDAAIQRGPVDQATTGIVPLFDEELIVVAAPTLLAGRQFLDDAELAALPLLQQSTRPTLWLEWFQAAGIDPRTTLRGHRFEQFSMLIEAAAAGLDQHGEPPGSAWRWCRACWSKPSSKTAAWRSPRKTRSPASIPTASPIGPAARISRACASSCPGSRMRGARPAEAVQIRSA